MTCKECGKPENWPWTHAGSCRLGLQLKNRLLSLVVPWLALATVAQAILLAWVFFVLGGFQ
jgi:hypothetical protein